MKQDERIYEIDNGFECWNLTKFSATEFVEAIKIKIPPFNDNILRNYINNGKDFYGISEEQYGKCLWGILVPDPDEFFVVYKEVLSILNLFSTKYMHPAFFITNTGINKGEEFNQNYVLPNDYQGYEYFKTLSFVSFFKTMADQMKYFAWVRNRVTSWGKEDWRLFMACGFYEGLEEYERSKTSYTWQRESADMAVLLETLFTAGDTQNEEIGYRLRKRIASLIQWKFPDIEKEIKVLYNDRSEFIHGSFYKKIIKGMKSNKNDDAMPPLPDFQKLHQTKERVRFILVAYLFLHKVMTSKSESPFSAYENVQQMLEEAVINIELRQKIIETIKPIIELLPMV
ncbi:MAG: hypothetical protein V4439_00370 [Patescibacteria group bacterium]